MKIHSYNERPWTIRVPRNPDAYYIRVLGSLGLGAGDIPKIQRLVKGIARKTATPPDGVYLDAKILPTALALAERGHESGPCGACQGGLSFRDYRETPHVTMVFDSEQGGFKGYKAHGINPSDTPWFSFSADFVRSIEDMVNYANAFIRRKLPFQLSDSSKEIRETLEQGYKDLESQVNGSIISELRDPIDSTDPALIQDIIDKGMKSLISKQTNYAALKFWEMSGGQEFFESLGIKGYLSPEYVRGLQKRMMHACAYGPVELQDQMLKIHYPIGSLHLMEDIVSGNSAFPSIATQFN